MAEGTPWWKSLLANRAFTHLGVLVLAVGAGIIYLKCSAPSLPTNPGQGPVVVAQPAAKAKKVKGKVESYPCPPDQKVRFVFLSKPDLAVALKMPELNQLQSNVIATADVAPHRGKTTAIATIGQGSDNVWSGGIVLRQEAAPFIGWEREWHGGLWYGAAGRNRIQGELEFLPMRIGPVFPSVKGVVGMEQGGDVNGQVLIGVRF